MKISAGKIALVLSAIIIAGAFVTANAQTSEQKPQVILTWQAYNFYPADYPGKALASVFTPIALDVEVVRNGKLLDLSGADFAWYLDEKIFANGRGIKETTFNVSRLDGDEHFVRVLVRLDKEDMGAALTIPVTGQKVSIDAPYAENLVKAGSKVFLRAIPYFFNAGIFEDLNFGWVVNYEAVRAGTDNQLTITLGTPQYEEQRDLPVSANVQNLKNPAESVSKQIFLKIY